MKKIGICVIASEGWFGGINYFLSLLSVLDQHPHQDHQYYVLTNRSDIFNQNYQPHINIIQCEWLTNDSKRLKKLCRHFKTNISLAYYARRYELDLITHALPGKRFLPPTIHWMPDFQHCHLPHLFSEAELRGRDQSMDMVAERSGHLILSSEAAEKDFRRFYPQHQSVKTQVLNFVPYIHEEDLTYQQQVLDKPDLKEDFFYLPNQFWTHKNHSVVLEAMLLLPPEIKVICTGSLNDYRNAAYTEQILRRIKTLGLEKRFIVLGLVERVKMMALIAEALAVINPSLFEGWSTTVEEAKYTGKKIILSDLAVHREQAPTDAVYFSPLDPVALAEAMLCIWQQKKEERQRATSRFFQARTQLSDNRSMFAKKYQSIVSTILQNV